jgi:N-acetylglucosamine kinase-like BadF-type ATPase
MHRRIIIADSGSSKTDWRMVGMDGRIESFSTTGLNPFYQSEEEVAGVIRDSFLPGVGSDLEGLFFYGAGCLAGAAHDKMLKVLSSFVKREIVFVNDDLMASARATLGHSEGIACILGTGSNSCFYDGKQIIRRIPAMGFILGDEGSGAVMGKKLVNSYFKEEMPADLRILFQESYKLSLEELLHRVYRDTFPNRYLAGFTYFLTGHQSHPWIGAFIKGCLMEFVEKNIAKYENYKQYQATFTGSLAEVFRNILYEVLMEKEIIPGKIIDRPIDSLVEFHLEE